MSSVAALESIRVNKEIYLPREADGILEKTGNSWNWKSSFIPEMEETREIEGDIYKLSVFPAEYKNKAEKILSKKGDTKYFITAPFSFKFWSRKLDSEKPAKEYEIDLCVIGVSLSNLFVENKQWHLKAIKDVRDGNIQMFEKDNSFKEVISKLDGITDDRCVCEHCQTLRKRNKVAIVSDGDGTLRVVGFSCLQQYINQGVFESLKKLNAFMKSFCPMVLNDENTDEFGKLIQHSKPANKIYPAETVIGFLYWLYKDFGYAYKSIKAVGFKNSTANELCYFFNGVRTDFGFRKEYNPSLDYEKTKIEDTPLEYIENGKRIAKEMFDKFHSDGQNMNEYETKLFSSIFEFDGRLFISERNFGFIGAYIEDVVKKEHPELNTSTFVGNIGDKIEIEGKVAEIRTIEMNDYTGWGTVERNSVTVLEKGNRFQFFNDGNFHVGDSIKLKGKIKDHREYKGVKTNVLCYVKIIEEKENNHPISGRNSADDAIAAFLAWCDR